MKRCVVNVATDRFVIGQRRLQSLLNGCDFIGWADTMPPGCPPHRDIPYAFKAHAIAEARARGYDLVLWADACIVPVPDLTPLWERIERTGYWISNNGWLNGEWCCDEALPPLGITREESFQQKHVVATAFGLNLRHTIGQQVADEYMRFAKNGAFRGPWNNQLCRASADPRVKGHRHDQTALSVIAHRLGLELTNPPDVFAYRGGETDATLLVADGAY